MKKTKVVKVAKVTPKKVVKKVAKTKVEGFGWNKKVDDRLVELKSQAIKNGNCFIFVLTENGKTYDTH